MDMESIYSETFWRLFDELDIPLTPSSPDALYDIAVPYVPADPHILDVGCRDASHLIRLLAHGGSGVGIDPVPWHVERASNNVSVAGLSDRVEIVRGVAKHVPFPDESFDLVWCRDVVEVLPDLDQAVAEMSRVLRPGAHLIAYTNVLAGEPNDNETTLIHQPLGNVVENLVEANLQRAFARHGLLVEQEWSIGTEWREYMEEKHGIVSRDLQRLSRLRRQQAHVVETYGERAYLTAQASLQWAAYQFLGRFVPVIYVLRKA